MAPNPGERKIFSDSSNAIKHLMVSMILNKMTLGIVPVICLLIYGQFGFAVISVPMLVAWILGNVIMRYSSTIYWVGVNTINIALIVLLAIQGKEASRDGLIGLALVGLSIYLFIAFVAWFTLCLIIRVSHPLLKR